MSYRNCVGPFGHSLSRGNVVNCMNNICAIVSIPTLIADADYYIFEDDEPALVLERLPFDRAWPHRAFAIVTAIFCAWAVMSYCRSLIFSLIRSIHDRRILAGYRRTLE